MKFLICMPTGKDGIQDDAVIRNALLTAVNRITLMDEKSGEFESHASLLRKGTCGIYS